MKMNEKMFINREEFRKWLTENALSDNGIWLVFDKQKESSSLSAGEALEEALCFGWIDGQMESIDEKKYRKYFKQRRKDSHWSDKNKKLIEKLESQNSMTKQGREKVKQAKENGFWDSPQKDELTDDHIQQFENMIQPYEPAYTNFMKMIKSVRKVYTESYFFGAKTEEGKQKRFTTIIERLCLNLNPMESMKKKLEEKNMETILFIMSGLPGSGKSTISKYIAKKYNAIYLRIDTIEQAIRELCNFSVQGEGYRLSYRIAEDNLKIGNNVVADSCNPVSFTRKEWENVAIKNNCKYINIETMCSNKMEHKKRIETRKTEIEGLKLPTWEEVIKREYDTWEEEHIIIDTANKKIELCIDELFKKMKI
jgi:predicted kinase/uncharacterized protein YdeI (YjbR/CyaY-like superfamily)